MRKSFVASMLLFSVLSFAQFAHAVTAWYQPTPYPLKKADGTAMLQSINIVHAWTGWLTNIYYGQTFQRDFSLQVGGWGDEYRTFIKLDLTGLPQSVDQAAMYLMPYPRGDSSTPVMYAVCSITSSWNLSLTWNTQPSYNPTCYGYAAPTPWTWSGFWLSGGGPNWYNQWKNGTLVNNGVMLFPYATNNNFDTFYSTLYDNYGIDPYADARRPLLGLTFTPTLELKMPLPGNHTWLVTTEVGGYDCKGSYDQYHDGSNYFSIDFSWKNVADSGATIYPNPDPNLNRQNNGVYIPVIAAKGGKVVKATYTSDNGYYVVINHSGGTTESTGFTTRYLHLQPPGPTVTENQTVQQGDIIGYMGNTGISNGAHLHFSVRYNNSGSSAVPETAKVVMDGWLLKSFQTECSVDANGLPTNWIRYYRSGNRVY